VQQHVFGCDQVKLKYREAKKWHSGIRQGLRVRVSPVTCRISFIPVQSNVLALSASSDTIPTFHCRFAFQGMLSSETCPGSFRSLVCMGPHISNSACIARPSSEACFHFPGTETNHRTLFMQLWGSSMQLGDLHTSATGSSKCLFKMKITI
jgi:hypothetical protein